MTKEKVQVYIEDDVRERLDAIAARYGTTKNSLLAMVAYEVSRINPETFWQMMGQIAAEQAPVAVASPSQAKRIPTPRHSKRLPVAKPLDVVTTT